LFVEKQLLVVIAHPLSPNLKIIWIQSGQREKIRYTMESVRHERYRWIRPRKCLLFSRPWI